MLEQLKDVLKRLKWTEGQASVYCTLVERGAMKPADLVVHAGVAQGKIYSILDELSESKGAVIRLDGRPTKYDAQNPRYVLDKLFDDVRELKENALQGAEEAYEKRYAQLVQDTTCWAVQGISGVLTQLRSLVGSCRSSLRVSDPDLSWVGTSEHKMFIKVIREEKTLQVLAGPAFTEVLEDLNNNGADVRTCERLSSYYLIDDETLLLRFSLPDCGVVIKDGAFVLDKAKQFESHFKYGSKLKTKGIED